MKNFALKSLLILFIFKANFFTAQDQEVLLTINGNPVYKSEFEQIYWKNKKESIATKDDLNEYIELFKKFKLKVAAAEELGLDTIQKFISELQGYRVQLEKPYLIDTSSNESLIKEAYYRTVNEISASHILVKVDPVYFRPTDVDSLLGNSKKAKKILKWKPKITFNQMVKEMIESDYNEQKKLIT